MDSAMDSLFAGYQKELSEQYDLKLMLDGDIEEELMKYLQYYADPATGLQKGGSYCKFDVQEIEVLKKAYAFDNDAYALQKEIKDAVTSIQNEQFIAAIKDAVGLFKGDAQNDIESDIELNQMLEQAGDVLQNQDQMQGTGIDIEEADTEEVDMESTGIEGKNSAAVQEETLDTEEESKYSLKSIQQLITTVKSIKKNGMLGLMGMEQISDRKVDRQNMPSQNVEVNQKVQLNQLNQIELNTYIMQFITCYSQQNQNPYDLEYILGNADNDRDNMKIVLKEVFSFRRYMNGIYLSSDSERKKEINDMVEVLFDGSELESAKEFICEFIQTAWVYAESILDIRKLIQGNLVPLSKDNNSWNLSLDQLLEGETAWSSNTKQNTGMTYQEYLELLLYKGDKRTIFFRTLDIIQWNINELYPDFTFDKAIYKLEIQADMKARPLFQFFSKGYSNLPVYSYQVSKTKQY